MVVPPLTSNVDSLFPGKALITVKGKQGRALGDQIRSIDKRRLKARLGAVTRAEMVRLEEALAVTVGLPL